MPRTKSKQVWADMVGRCTNPKVQHFPYYGGRGITVCDEWLSYENFKQWFESTYIEGLSIDRIDNEKGYRPDNCRWATKSQQAKNKRFTKRWENALSVSRLKRTARLAEKAKTLTKKCPSCRKFKLRKLFYKKPTASDNCSTECKVCQSKRSRLRHRRKNGRNQ